MEWRNAVLLSKLKPGKPRMVNIGLKTLMVVQDEGMVHATEGLCRHMRWPLAWGAKVKDDCIRCPLHQTTHKISDGELVEWSPFPLFPPYGKLLGKMSRKKDLKVYNTRVNDSKIQVQF